MTDAHNLTDYEEAYDSFEWEDVFEAADWDAPEELNVGFETCDRHAGDGRVALHHLGVDGEETKVTFQELAERSNRFAHAIADLGVERGDRVFTYMPRIPEHYVALVGTLKRGAVFGGVNERSPRSTPRSAMACAKRLERSASSWNVTSVSSPSTPRW